ncbi:hypothetical protein MKW92_028342 [Papaver armeniacum]|nr:hypothetical protein MKW92_028342 [Papaver armeniacum]
MEKMGNLASSSSKPHFFQPIHPDCSSADQLAIPKAFQVDYLVDREDSEGVATLKSPLKSWKVKLNDFKFTDVEYSVMSEGEAENEMHCGETGIEGMDRAESKGKDESKSKGQGQGRQEETSSEGNLNTDFVCANRCNT